MVPANSRRIPRAPRYSGYCYQLHPYVYRTFTVYGLTFQIRSTSDKCQMSQSYNPNNAKTSSVWALPLSLATTRGITFCFLFLEVLRCFSSLSSPPFRDDRSSTCRVAPFGNLRIKGRLHLPEAYRSLPRPSSPPRA